MRAPRHARGFVVVNDAGHVVPCMDNGKTLHRVAIWTSKEQAERFATRMRVLNRHVEYDVRQALLAYDTDGTPWLSARNH